MLFWGTTNVLQIINGVKPLHERLHAACRRVCCCCCRARRLQGIMGDEDEADGCRVSVLDKVTCCASLSEYLAAERRSGASVRLHAGKQRDLSVNKRNIFITLIFTGCFSDFRSVFTSAPCRSVLPLRAAALCRCSVRRMEQKHAVGLLRSAATQAPLRSARCVTVTLLRTKETAARERRPDMFSELSDMNLTSNFSADEPLSALEPDWSDTPQQRLSRSGHRVVSVFLGSIMVFGFLNNLLVLVLFCRFKTLRTPVNMLLLNISVSDMLVCVCGTTLSFASSLRTRWLYGRHGCMWYGFINSCFGESSCSLRTCSFVRNVLLQTSAVCMWR
eukprot:superscaffoldBa00011155_g25079